MKSAFAASLSCRAWASGASSKIAFMARRMRASVLYSEVFENRESSQERMSSAYGSFRDPRASNVPALVAKSASFSRSRIRPSSLRLLAATNAPQSVALADAAHTPTRLKRRRSIAAFLVMFRPLLDLSAFGTLPKGMARLAPSEIPTGDRASRGAAFGLTALRPP